MALSTEGIVLAKRKLLNYLTSGTKGNPFAVAQFKELFSYLSQHGANPDLQFVPFANLTDATVIADAACKCYGVYMKKQNTATDAFGKLVDHASAGDGSTFFLCAELDAAKQVFVALYPDGLPLANGIVATSSTTATGTTDSTSGDGPDGFVLLGAA